MPKARRWVIAAVLTAGSMLAGVSPAVAHTELVGSTPQDGAFVHAPVNDVILEFSEPVGGSFTQVAVLDEEDVDWATGQPRVAAETVTQPVRELAPGNYRISYRVVATDGHPITGTIGFTMVAAGQPTSQSASPGATRGLSAILLVGVMAAAVAGAVAFVLVGHGARSPGG